MLDNQIPFVTNEFGLQFFNTLSAPIASNVVFSPWSLINTLGVILLGTGWQSRTQLELIRTLNYRRVGGDLITFHEQLREIRDKLKRSVRNKEDPDNTIRLEQMNLLLYNHKRAQLYSRFRDGLGRYYESSIDDFTNPVDWRGPLHNRINRWVANATGKTISNFEDPTISQNAHLLVIFIDAFHFKGKWLHNFEVSFKSNFYNQGLLKNPSLVEFYSFQYPKKIEYAKFTSAGEDPYRTSDPTTIDLDCRVFVLPYKQNRGKEFSVVFLVPNGSDQVEELQRKLSNSVLVDIYLSLRMRDAYVTLPKLAIETEHQAGRTLSNMGLKTLFTASKDFGLMFVETPQIGYTKIKQRARVSMDAGGLEMSASSRDSLEETGVLAHSDIIVPNLILNRPFLFIIRHNPTNVSLVIGRVSSL